MRERVRMWHPDIPGTLSNPRPVDRRSFDRLWAARGWLLEGDEPEPEPAPDWGDPDQESDI